ncbi:MAG TPA: amidohydrolase family protein [Phycisphaeraceae bacterium]
MAEFVLDDARLWVGDGTSLDGHVVVRDGSIGAVERGRYRGGLEVISLGGAALSPGMIDLMVLGGFGLSILRDDVRQIARQYLRYGVTAMQCCIGTLPWEAMKQVAANVQQARADQADAGRSQVLGLYLEGPFQHPRLTGASLAAHALPPSLDNVERVLTELGEAVTMINVSPGTEGDAQAVRRLAQAGKVVTMAHSNAPAERVVACVENGTSGLGHAFNNNNGAMKEGGVQQPTLEHVALLDERVRFLHLICDGTHVDPWLIRLMLRCRGVEALCLVTDGNQRMGCPDGPFVWDDGQRMYKKDGVCRIEGSNGLAGSATLLPQMFRNLVRFTGLAPERAIQAVTLNPARSLGLEERMGLIAPGRRADLVAWDQDLRVQRVWLSGRACAQVHDLEEVPA